MKRSQINRTIEIAKEVFATIGLYLPPFAFWTVDDWKLKGHEADEIRKAMLGWDVTDFGQGNFVDMGRTLFTLRNGFRSESGLSKPYAEKFILNPTNQKPPFHFHRSKMEDIINRGGGNITIKLCKSTSDGKRSEGNFTIQVDGVTLKLKAGTIVRLEPGQSICILPFIFHQFWGEPGMGIEVAGTRYVVSGEISSFCDDWNDNCFLEPVERFPSIEEDEPLRHYLCNEYPLLNLENTKNGS